MSVDISTLAIQIQSDGVLVASNRLKELSDKGGAAEKSVNSLSSASDRLAGYLKAAAAALATWKLTEYIKEATLLAARVETLGVVMKQVGANAGYTSSQMDGFLTQVKKMGITTQESMASLVKMAGAQMDLTKASKLARVAQDAAVIGGVNSSEAFGRMIAGIQKGEQEILETIGINVKWEDGYKKLAVTLGTTADKLSAAEKMTARVNQVLEFGANIAGTYEASLTTAGKMMQSMSRFAEELSLKVGQIFLPQFTSGVNAFSASLKFVMENFDSIASAATALGGLGIAALFGNIAGSIYSAARAQTVYVAQMLQGNVVTLGSATATKQKALAQVEATQADLAAASAKVRDNEATIAAIAAARAEAVAHLAVTTSVQGRALVTRELATLGAQQTAVTAQLTAATTAETAAQGAAAAAIIAHSRAMSGATLSSQALSVAQTAMTGVINGTKAAFALLGGEIGLIIIALASLTYAWEKYKDRQAAINREIAEGAKDSLRARLLKENEELESQMKGAKNPVQTAEEEIVRLKKQELSIQKEIATLNEKISHPLKYGLLRVGQAKDRKEVLEAQLRGVSQDIAFAPQLIKYNAELKAKQEAERVRKAEEAAKAAAKAGKAGTSTQTAEKIAEAARMAAQAEANWKSASSDLRREISLLNPTLSEHDKDVLELNARYTDLAKEYPKHTAALKTLQAEHLAAIGTASRLKDALAVQANMDKAWEGEQKLRTERATTAAQLEIQMKEQQGLRQEALELQFKMENAALAEQGVYEGQVKVLKDKVDALRMAAEQEKAAKELAAIQQDNKSLATSLISDPYEQEKQAIRDRYEMEKAAQEKALKAAEKDAARRAAIQKNLALLEQKYIKDTADTDAEAQRAKLQATSYYTGMAGDLFGQLATLQDESSRKGFEAAKDYNLAAAVVSTAAAVMNALATVQPYPAAVAAAAMAAATGAIQIAKIESTSFGGGSGSVSAPSGSFTASGGGSTSGGSIGKPYKSLQQSQDADVMERLAASMENASVEMRRVADGLVSFQDVLSNEQGKRNLEGAPNRYMATSNESSWLHKVGGTIMDTLGFESTKFIREGDWSGLFKQLRDFSLSAGGGLLGNALWGQGNKWKTTGGGVSLGITDGELEGMNYIDRKKSGGLFKSSKKKTEYSALDEGFAYWLENTLGDVGYSTNLAANVLGTKANIGSVNLPTAKIKTSGRSTEDIQKDLEKWFQSVGNAFAKTVDGLEAFTAPGEEAFAALMRLATSLQTVNDNFNLIGKTLLDSSLTGGNTASKLADLFGGLEQFSESMETYFTSMFTDAEQQALLQKQAQVQVNSAFKEMGVAIPATKDAFKSLVNSLDVTTESGAQLFAALIEVAPAFADMIDLTEKIAKATRDFNADLDLRLMRLNGEDTSLFELRIQQQEEWAKAVDSGMDLQKLRIVQDKEWARAVQEVTGQVSDAVQDMVASAKSAVLDLIDAQIAIGKTKVSIMTGPLSNLSPEAAYFQSKSAFESVAGKTDLESLRKLPELAQAFLNASRGYNASGADYQTDLIKVLTELDRAMGISGGGISETQKQIDLLENIKTAIETGATGTVNQLAAMLGPNSTLAGLIGTWSEATEAKLAQDKKNAAIETYYREQDKYTEAVKAIGADFAAGKITFADYTSQATALYSPVQTAWGTATDLGATGLTSTGIANPPARDDSRLLTDIKTKIYTELQGEFMGAYPPFEGSWTNERGNPVTASASYIASIYGTESAFAQLDRLINYARTYHIAGYAKGGFYPGGSALMGEVGPEFVDSAPGYVYRADETKALFEMAKRGIADNYSAELVAEIRELRREVAELRGTAEKGNRIAQAVGTELAEIGTEGNRQRGQVVKGERMRGAA